MPERAAQMGSARCDRRDRDPPQIEIRPRVHLRAAGPSHERRARIVAQVDGRIHADFPAQFAERLCAMMRPPPIAISRQRFFATIVPRQVFAPHRQR